MNLSAQDHQAFFICDADIGKPDYESIINNINLFLLIVLDVITCTRLILFK